MRNKNLEKVSLSIVLVAILGTTNVYGNCSADVEMGGNKITSTATPTQNNDLTNKSYVDFVVANRPAGVTTISPRSTSSVNYKTAVNACSIMEPRGSWKLPTLSELLNMCATEDANCTETDSLWTSTRSANSTGYWVRLNPSNDTWSSNLYFYSNYYRCVK